MRRTLKVALLTAVASLAHPADASIIIHYFPDFGGAVCNGGNLSCNGNASLTTTADGRILRATPALFGQSGSAFGTSQIALGAGDTFSTFFQFRFTQPGGIDPADGITFTLQTVSNAAGGAGGGMGYAGLSPSVALEFDTFNNGGADGNSSNHVAVNVDGHIIDGTPQSDQHLTFVNGNQVCDFGSATSHARPGCMSNGDLWSAWIDYDGSHLSVALADGGASGTLTRPATNILDNIPIDIASILGQGSAFVGFTAGTGAGTENHDIRDWIFDNTYAPINPGSVPEPGTLELICGALAASLLRSRNRSKD